jgi:hypothetical protein
MPWAPTRIGLDGVVEGFPAIFGNKDDDGEVVEKGAFAKSISERVTRIPVALDHTRGFAVTTHLEEVSRDDLPQSIKSDYPDATGGLFGRGQIVLMGEGLAWAKAEKDRVEKGRPSGMSFVADIVRRDGDRLTELALAEWGPQARNQAINRGARVTSVKGAVEGLDLGTLLIGAGFDDREELEFMTAVKAGRVLSRTNKNALRMAIQELQRVLSAAAREEEDEDDPEGEGTEKGTSPLTAKSRLREIEALAIELELMRIA